jgi:hypothetical protein
MRFLVFHLPGIPIVDVVANDDAADRDVFFQ